MFPIVEKKRLNDAVVWVKLKAPLIARKVQAGQFIMFRLDEFGERVPLTVADYDREAGTITLIFQIVGESTRQFAALEEGDSILDLVGPLGMPTEIPEGTKSACVIGGGVGCAIAYPQAKQLHAKGIAVDTIAGFRSKDIVILEDEFRSCSDNLYLCTDDGSYGTKGFVTNVLQQQLEALSRGLVTVTANTGVFISWRLFKSEVTGHNATGLTGTDFVLYKNGVRLALSLIHISEPTRPY